MQEASPLRRARKGGGAEWYWRFLALKLDIL